MGDIFGFRSLGDFFLKIAFFQRERMLLCELPPAGGVLAAELIKFYVVDKLLDPS